jgi:hypothetical protein
MNATEVKAALWTLHDAVDETLQRGRPEDHPRLEQAVKALETLTHVMAADSFEHAPALRVVRGSKP